MAANKFATMLHRSTHSLGVILVYTVLEWALMVFLLLNGLFSYLISRFASYFGLTPPCLLCSRLDHLFEPDKGRRSYRSLLCEDHAAEISQLGFCSHHRKLAEAVDMCEDCCCSSWPPTETDHQKSTMALFSLMRSEREGKDSRCSCCEVPLESGFYSLDLLLKPSLGIMECAHIDDIVQEKDDLNGVENREGVVDDGQAPVSDHPLEEGYREEGVVGKVRIPYSDHILERGFEEDDMVAEVQAPVIDHPHVEGIERDGMIGEVQAPGIGYPPEETFERDDAADEEQMHSIDPPNEGLIKEEETSSVQQEEYEVEPEQEIPIAEDDVVVETSKMRCVIEGGDASLDAINLCYGYESVAEERLVPLYLIDSATLDCCKSRAALAEGNVAGESTEKKPDPFADLMRGFDFHEFLKLIPKINDRTAKQDVGRNTGSLEIPLEAQASIHDIIIETKDSIIDSVASSDDSLEDPNRTQALVHDRIVERKDNMKDLVTSSDGFLEDLQRDQAFFRDSNTESLIVAVLEKGHEENQASKEDVKIVGQDVFDDTIGIVLNKTDLGDQFQIQKPTSPSRHHLECSSEICDDVEDKEQQAAGDEGKCATASDYEASSESEICNEIENKIPDVKHNWSSDDYLSCEVPIDSEVNCHEKIDHYVSQEPFSPLACQQNQSMETFSGDEDNAQASRDHQRNNSDAKCEVTFGSMISEYEQIEYPKLCESIPSLVGQYDVCPSVDTEDDDEEKDVKADGDAICEVSIGSEICEQEQIAHSQLLERIPSYVGELDQPMEYSDEPEDNDRHETEGEFETREHELNYQLPVIAELDEIEDRILETTVDAEVPQTVDHRLARQLSGSQDHNETEEDRMPETPGSLDGIYSLHKRFSFDKRDLGTESVDGSVASEHEGSEILTMEHLKSALKAERRALSALYSELEEERSASAIAANQTMAMITRLQEEKAAMQMEALQYQRMMEEQSEYDQEALHLLNELMMKKEKEKQEMERELDVYRKKVLIYEAKERQRMKKVEINQTNGTSPASSSAEDSDDLSFEHNEAYDHLYGLDESNQSTPIETILCSGPEQESSRRLITLDESYTDFEEERLAILDQLKDLEEKLFTMDVGEKESANNMEFNDHLAVENGHSSEENNESANGELNGFSNGNSDFERRRVSSNGKRLLPLFDAVSMENGVEVSEEQAATDVSPQSVSKLASEQKKLAILEEIDRVHDRLHGLEADREFLKHSIRSLKKGDKGIHLLQEILQHLRDLRNVELRAQTSGDGLAPVPF